MKDLTGYIGTLWTRVRYNSNERFLLSLVLLFALFVGSGVVWQYIRLRKGHVTAPTTDAKSKKLEPSSIDLSSIKSITHDFGWSEQPETPYRPWHNGPYHVTMGIKSFDMKDWIELDHTYLKRYNMKKKLFRENREEVLQVLPGCEDGLFEALDLLRDTLIRRYPSMFRLLNPHTIENLITGDVWDLSRDANTWRTHHPLEVMGLLATEDFLTLQTDENRITTLRSAGVCFPAGFKIEERIGLNLWQIHAPSVPSYKTKLARSMDKFFSTLRVGSQVQRFNFAIDDSDELFHRHSHHNLDSSASGSDKEIKLEDLHLRVERQCLQRLPRSRALLFTIRTYVTPITEVTRDKDVARGLRTSVDSFGAELAGYKNRGVWNEVFQRHVADVLGETDEMEG